MNECCANCKYFYDLKHNYKVGKGFEESTCCIVLIHQSDKSAKDPWVQEVSAYDRCEMFVKKESE